MKLFSKTILALLLLRAAGLTSAPLFPITIPWSDSLPNANSAAFLNDHQAGTRGYITVDGAGHLSNSAGRISSRRPRWWEKTRLVVARIASVTTSAPTRCAK